MNLLENIIKDEWNKKNSENILFYSPETLKKRTIHSGYTPLYLIHNSIRDVYDRLSSDHSKHQVQLCPFCGILDNEILKICDDKLRILGNKFACMQYQSIVVPQEHIEILTEEYLNYIITFAFQHPTLTFLYNADNAGKAVKHCYWLMSFYEYEPLREPFDKATLLYSSKDFSILKREIPSYRVEFEVSDKENIVNLIMKTVSFVENKNFNLFIYANRIYFIPRENIETPDGFNQHRFGGMEMIGYFIMKSKKDFESVDSQKLLTGINQISYNKSNQEKFESYILSLIK